MSQMRGGEGQIVRKTSKRSKLILGAAVASALAGLTASSVRATNYSWTGGAAGAPFFWDDNTNWSSSPVGTFPVSGDNANFGSGPVNTAVDLHALTQTADTVSFLNTSGSYSLNNGVLQTNVGLVQSGNASNTIGAAVNANAAWTISAGTLNANQSQRHLQ
jgi:hypothetical protein